MRFMAYTMGIDLGTSSLKTVVIDENGTLKAVASRGYQFQSPCNNFAEHDPEEWWEACVHTVKQAIQEGGIRPEEIKGVSFSGQMHGIVVLDWEYKSIRPAILHCDARSGRQVEQIKTLFGIDEIRRLMMNPVYTGFLLPSLLWIRDNEPANFDRIRHVFLPKDYLTYKLTGLVATDYSDASATLAFDMRNMCWSEEILNKVHIPLAWFPRCFETGEVIGTVTAKAAGETGLAVGTVIVAGGGDQVMQGIGSGIIEVGQASANIGTSGQVSFQSTQPLLNPELNTNTFMGYKKNRWIVMGAIMNAGLCYKWFHSLFPKADYEEMNRLISQVQPGSGGVIFLPYLNGERTPHLDPDLSASFIGINLRTGKTELARAVMEGVSYAMYQCIELCGSLGLVADMMVASGGGARSMPWLQMQADIYNIPLKVAEIEEQAGLGAAIAAGVGAGIYKDIQEGCKRVVRYKDLEVIPDRAVHAVYMEYYGLFKEAFASGRETLHRLTVLGRKNRKGEGESDGE